MKTAILLTIAALAAFALTSCASFSAEASVDTLTGHAKLSFKSEQFNK